MDRMWHNVNFKWSEASLNSVFLLLDRLLSYLLIAGERQIKAFLTQSASLGIWSQVTNSFFLSG